jgi:hypothetical protein
MARRGLGVLRGRLFRELLPSGEAGMGGDGGRTTRLMGTSSSSEDDNSSNSRSEDSS